MSFDPYIGVYVAPLIVIWLLYQTLQRRSEARVTAIRDAAIEAGLTQPASLHPVIDPATCLGCGACARACPEGTVLGLIGGRAELIEPTQCIGHGACKAACPYDAIDLVFGTAERGVDIPVVGHDFQTNVAGIFIAGELGGMGLIRNAIEQGRQAMDEIARLDGLGHDSQLDVVIVGGGPAGISASLAALEMGLRFVTIEQDSFGGTVSHFPRGKLVMTQPANLPIYGRVGFREVSKEKLLALWHDVAQKTGLRIRYGERVDDIRQRRGGMTVVTNRGQFETRATLLAIGRRGSPRKLGVPGEQQTKVVYRLIDPEQYGNMHVLVVGGGDSALEAAASIAEKSGTTVTLSYRSAAFSRAKLKNRQRVEKLAGEGRISLMMPSTVAEVGKDNVSLQFNEELVVLQNDAVIVCAGGILPTGFLKKIGIEVETKHGTA